MDIGWNCLGGGIQYQVTDQIVPMITIHHLISAANFMASDVPATRHKSLDAVRALGVVLVMMYHLRWPHVRNAWMCIGFFFTLSGFIITATTFDTFRSRGAVSVVTFWSRRMTRLFPALLAGLLGVCLGLAAQRAGYLGTPPSPQDLWYHQRDLLWGLFYGENFNLMHRQNDYFAQWQRPPIVQHLWSLAIEEQYYLVWPVLFVLWTSAAQCLFRERAAPADPELAPPPPDAAAERPPAPEGPAAPAPQRRPAVSEARYRFALKAMALGDCVVIAASHCVTQWVVREHGVHVAYFSSWLRSGEFACGGLLFCLMELTPALRDRYRRARDAPPLAPAAAVLVELLYALVYPFIVATATMPFAPEEVLPTYFAYLRLPLTTLMMLLALAGAMQDPPKWAVVSRVMHAGPVVFLGQVSYGVYVYHFPLIWWFGSPVWAQAAAQDAPYAWQCARDGLIMAAAVALGAVSALRLEYAVLRRARGAAPLKILSVGLLSSAAVAVVVLAATHGAADPDDVLADYSGAGAPARIVPPAPADAPEPPEALEAAAAAPAVPPPAPAAAAPNASAAPDARFPPPGDCARPWGDCRPVFFITPVDRQEGTIDMWLDAATLPNRKSRFEDKYTIHWGKEKLEQAQGRMPARAVVLACAQLQQTLNPCAPALQWRPHAHWIWVATGIWELCGTAPPGHAKHAACPKRLQVTWLSVPSQPPPGTVAPMSWALLHMLNAAVRAVPAAFNPVFRARIAAQSAELQSRGFVRVPDAAAAGVPPLLQQPSLSVVYYGDSVSRNIHRLMAHVAAQWARAAGARGNWSAVVRPDALRFPALAFHEKTHPASSFFRDFGKGSLAPADPGTLISIGDHSLCYNMEAKNYLEADNTVPPDFSPACPDREFWAGQLSNLLVLLLQRRTARLFLVTNSLYRVGAAQRQLLAEVLGRYRCPVGRAPELTVTVVAWHLLVCPPSRIAHGRCPVGAHGFGKILRDAVHPTGPPGLWLAAQVLQGFIYSLVPKPIYHGRGVDLAQFLQYVYPADHDPSMDEFTEVYGLCAPSQMTWAAAKPAKKPSSGHSGWGLGWGSKNKKSGAGPKHDGKNGQSGKHDAKKGSKGHGYGGHGGGHGNYGKPKKSKM